jgi:hypothetical protein
VGIVVLARNTFALASLGKVIKSGTHRELRGLRPHEFEEDLRSAIKHLDVIDSSKEHAQLFWI